MNIYHRIVGCFSVRRKSLAFYRQGMAKARRRDYQAAIGDYTSAIDVVGIPVDVKAMTLYNRALAYVAIEDVGLAAKDLGELLGMPNAPTHIKTEAERKLARMQQRAQRSEQGTANGE